MDAVTQWLNKNGITPTPASTAGDLLEFTVSVDKANDLLNANFTPYVHESTNTTMMRTLSYALPSGVQDHVSYIYPTTQYASLAPVCVYGYTNGCQVLSLQYKRPLNPAPRLWHHLAELSSGCDRDVISAQTATPSPCLQAVSKSCTTSPAHLPRSRTTLCLSLRLDSRLRCPLTRRYVGSYTSLLPFSDRISWYQQFLTEFRPDIDPNTQVNYVFTDSFQYPQSTDNHDEAVCTHSLRSMSNI